MVVPLDPVMQYPAALPPLGSMVLDSGDFVADAQSKVEEIYDYFSGGQDPVSFAALGVGTSTLTVISSSIVFQKGRADYAQAKKAHDVGGAVLGGIRTVRAGILIGVTVIFIPFRILAAAFVGTLSRVIVLGLAFFSNLTGVGFLVVDLLNLVTYCIKIHEERMFIRDFYQARHDPGKTPEERREEAVDFLKRRLQVTAEEREEIEAQCAHLEGEERAGKIKRKIERLAMRKEAKLRRVLSYRCIQMIRDERTDPDLLIRTIKSRSRRNLVKLVVKLTVVVVAILSLIAGMLVVHPAGLIAVTVFSILSSGALLAIDLYDNYKDFKNSYPGRHDMAYLKMSTVLGFAAMITCILCAANGTALAIALALGMIWLISNAIAYVRLAQMRFRACS